MVTFLASGSNCLLIHKLKTVVFRLYEREKKSEEHFHMPETFSHTKID